MAKLYPLAHYIKRLNQRFAAHRGSEFASGQVLSRNIGGSGASYTVSYKGVHAQGVTALSGDLEAGQAVRLQSDRVKGVQILGRVPANRRATQAETEYERDVTGESLFSC